MLKRHGINHKRERAWTDQIFESPDDALKPLPRFKDFTIRRGPICPGMLKQVTTEGNQLKRFLFTDTSTTMSTMMFS